MSFVEDLATSIKLKKLEERVRSLEKRVQRIQNAFDSIGESIDKLSGVDGYNRKEDA